LQFKKDYMPKEESVRRAALERGYEIASGSISVNYHEGKAEWSFVAVVLGRRKESRITELAAELAQFDGVENFNLSHARN
jgi:putative Mg2+ transporter-C (MgtC) family protein